MGFARALLALLVIFAIGLVGYQIGVSQNIAAQLPAVAAPGGVPVAYYGYPYHWGFGFGFFGFLFPLFFLFLFFGLMRAILGGGRGWGHRGWYADGDHGVPSRFNEWHTRSHGDSTSTSGPATPRQ